MKKEIEEKIKEWLLSQGEYVGTGEDGKIENLSSVCLDGNFNIKELAEIITDQARQKERERIIEEIKKTITRGMVYDGKRSKEIINLISQTNK